jgi:hypothetical protein
MTRIERSHPPATPERASVNRLHDILWNLIPLFAAFGAAAMRIAFDPPVPGILSFYGFDFGLASIFGFAAGRHIHRVPGLNENMRNSFLAATCIGIAATAFEFMCPYNTFDPLDILAYWIGIAYALAGLRLLRRFEHKGDST